MRFTIALLAALLSLAGCDKSEKVTAPSVPDKLDFAKFQKAFPAAPPAQLSLVREASDDIRHRLYPAGLAALDKLAADPTLTEAQKTAVNDMIQGVKEVIAKGPAPSP